MSVQSDKLLDLLVRIKQLATSMVERGDEAQEARSIDIVVSDALRIHEVHVRQLEEQLAARNAKIVTMQMEADANSQIAQVAKDDLDSLSGALELIRGIAEAASISSPVASGMAHRRIIDTAEEALASTCLGVEQNDGFIPQVLVPVVKSI